MVPVIIITSLLLSRVALRAERVRQGEAGRVPQGGAESPVDWTYHVAAFAHDRSSDKVARMTTKVTLEDMVLCRLQRVC